MSAHDRLAAAAVKVGAVVSVVRVRREDEVRARNLPNGGADREASRLSEIVRRLEKTLS